MNSSVVTLKFTKKTSLKIIKKAKLLVSATVISTFSISKPYVWKHTCSTHMSLVLSLIWRLGGRTRVNFFLVGPKDPKISVLTNFFGGAAHFPVAHEATQQG